MGSVVPISQGREVRLRAIARRCVADLDDHLDGILGCVVQAGEDADAMPSKRTRDLALMLEALRLVEDSQEARELHEALQLVLVRELEREAEGHG